MNDKLDGWKAVASHVRKSVRTAQRWERELGLPVRRMPTENGEIVYAFTAEIDTWAQERERRPRGAKPAADTRPEPPSPLPAAPPPSPADSFSAFPYARVAQVVPSILIPLSPHPRLVPWLTGAVMLLLGTLLGWLLGHARLN